MRITSQALYDQLSKACVYFANPQVLGRLPLAILAWEARQIQTFPHLRENFALPPHLLPLSEYGNALRQVIELSLDKLKPDTISSSAIQVFRCLHNHIYPGLKYAEADAHSLINAATYSRRLEVGMALLAYHVAHYLSQYVHGIPAFRIRPRRLLSPKEHLLLQLAAHETAATKELADQMGWRAPTVETYWVRVRVKLGAGNRIQALWHAHQLGLIDLGVS